MNKMFSKSDILNTGETVDAQEFKENAVDKLKSILGTVFTDCYPKTQIKVMHNRINFACPFCMDSAIDSTKKRGNLILEGKFANTYKCFNCGVFMPIDKFFTNFDKGFKLNLAELDYVTQHRNEYSVNNTTDAKELIKSIVNIDLLERVAVDREVFKQRLCLNEVTKDLIAFSYLKNRGQYDFDKYLYSPRRKELFMLNLTPSGKILGCQTRNIDVKQFRTYNTKNMYFILLKIKMPDGITEYVNNVSMLFNICLVDINKPVIATEGPMDSFLLNNCVALVGANKHQLVPLNFYFLYDSDEAGTKASLTALNNGFNIFMWEKFLKDHNIPSKKKWDWNDIVLYTTKNNIQIKNILNYFSNDKLDLLFL